MSVKWCLFWHRTPHCVDTWYDLGMLAVEMTHPGVMVSSVQIHTTVPGSKESQDRVQWS